MNRQVKFANLVAYGATDMLGAGAVGVTGAWILFFYTTFCGLNPLQAASIFAIARGFDMVVSPLMGHISDNFGKTGLGRHFGRRRFFLLLSIILLPSFALMWISGQTYFYYLLSYIFFDAVYAMVLVPYETLASEMSRNYSTKAKFAGVRLMFGQVASLLAGYLPGRLIDFLGKKDANTFLYVGIIFSVLFIVVVFLTWRFSWERPVDEVESLPSTIRNPIVDLYSNLFSTLKVRSFRVHLGMYLGGYIAMDILNAVFAYFIIFVYGGSVILASNLLGLMAFCQLFGVIAAIGACLTIQPAATYRISAVLYITGLLSLLALAVLRPAYGPTLVYATMAVVGLGRGGLAYVPWNLYNYMGDVDEIITGRRRDGTLAGVMNLARKAGQAIAVMAVGVLLERTGFVAKAPVQSLSSQHAITALLIGGSVTLVILGLASSLSLKLNAKTHALLSTVVDRFKSGDMSVTDPEKRILIALTGWPFEKLWGRGARTF